VQDLLDKSAEVLNNSTENTFSLLKKGRPCSLTEDADVLHFEKFFSYEF